MNKFSLILSGSPTTVDAKDFNKNVIDPLNNTNLVPRGLEGLDKIGFAWAFDVDAHYFVRPNFSIDAGVGQLKTISKREFLPAINAAVQFRAELLSVPVHLGGDYYLPAYNQGDFQARMYVGGGLLSLVYNRAKFQGTFTGTDSANTFPNFKLVERGDSPGYYAESGVHMFFGGRYSVQLGVQYRSAVVRNPEGLFVQQTATTQTRTEFIAPYNIDYSGIGAKLGLAIGL